MCGEKMNRASNKAADVCRLPKGIDINNLCMMKGVWPKRELSQKELLETYKNHYSSRSRRETMLMLDAFKKKYGEDIYEVVKEVSYKMGKEAGEAEKRYYKSLLNKIVDISVRPYCYLIHHYETTPEKIAYKVLECSFANLLKEMELEEIGTYMCPPWHEAYAQAFGFRFSMPKSLLKGDDCCEQIWESLNHNGSKKEYIEGN